jgi:hypothetical protein
MCVWCVVWDAIVMEMLFMMTTEKLPFGDCGKDWSLAIDSGWPPEWQRMETERKSKTQILDGRFWRK